jgi:hypothetical protein
MAGLRGDRTLDSGSEISGLTKFASTSVYWIKNGQAKGYDFGADRMLD